MKRFVQIMIIFIPVAIFFWLLYLDIVPSGEQRVVYSVGSTSPYIQAIRPSDRVLPLQEGTDGREYVTIIDDPAYFSVQVPDAGFESVEMEVVFDPESQGILELGALVDVFSQSFDLRPLHNEMLDVLEWPSVTENNVTLFQRTSDFTSIEDFWASAPIRSEIATYHYDVNEPYRIANYEPLGSEREVNFSLRGHHKFYTYVKDEALQIDLTYMDMNRKVGEDEVRVILRDENGEEVDRVVYADDGNIDENQISSTRTISLYETGLPEGVYSVELSTTSDVFWRQLKTNLRYVTFSQTVYLGDIVGHLPGPEPVEFYTNAKHLVFETLHADALQRIDFEGQEVSLDETHEKIRTTINQSGIVRGYSPVGDVKIVGDGKFAFSVDMFFDPDPVPLSVLTDLDSLGVNYVLTTYTPEEVEGWRQRGDVFDLYGIVNEDGVATFVFSAPLIGEMQNNVKIEKIIATFKKDPMSFREVVGAMRERIPFGL